MLTASVGTYSGPVGAQIRTILAGTQLWVKYINDKGGLNGHKVKLLVYDDAGDPGRHRAHVQEAIEHKRVLAFLEQGGAISGGASVDYITAKRVPVIGSEGATAGFYTSPMYFPQQSHGDALALTLVLAAADQAIPEGKEKLGVLVCAEAQTCSDLDRVASRQAESAGFDVVYRGKASLAQPDYTAECLAARNAGVELMLVLFDGSSIERLAASCARQSYRPTFVSGAGILLDRFKEDPNLDGFIGASQVFLWFQSGTPGVDEFHHAVRAYGGRGILPGVGAATGWVSGKLLEKAGANLPEPPTTDAILRGLWGIKGDTLGGITQPLTFVENQPATPLSCWFNLRVKKGAWVTPDGFKLHCKN